MGDQCVGMGDGNLEYYANKWDLVSVNTLSDKRNSISVWRHLFCSILSSARWNCVSRELEKSKLFSVLYAEYICWEVVFNIYLLIYSHYKLFVISAYRIVKQEQSPDGNEHGLSKDNNHDSHASSASSIQCLLDCFLFISCLCFRPSQSQFIWRLIHIHGL